MKSSKRTLLVSLAGLATISMGSAFAQEQGRVISTTPVITQVAVPRQVCSNEQVVTQAQQKSGAGAVIGGVAGGVIGNAAGKGNGRAAMTMIGVIGGAILGDHVEGSNVQQAHSQNVQRCTTQIFYENRPTAYNVVYEFNGKQYQVQLPQDPGPFVSLQVTPVGGSTQPAQPAPAPVRPIVQAPVQAQPVYAQPVIVESSTVYVQQPQVVYVRPAPIIYAPPVYHHYPRPHAHSHLHPHLQPQHLAYPQRPHHQPNHQPHHRPHHRPSSVVSIGYSGHFR